MTAPLVFRTVRAGVGALVLVGLAWLLLARVDSAQASGPVTICDDAHFTSALAGGGLVSFNCNGNHSPATIVVGATKMITQNTTIDGGDVIALSGGGGTRVLLVSAGVYLTLTNITVRDGFWNVGDGGAIRNEGTLTILNSRFYSNATSASWSGSAIYTIGPLNIINSEFAYNTGGGGALKARSAGSVTTISGSNFHHNQSDASLGGGFGGAMQLHDAPWVSVNGTTFFSNTAGASGGAVYVNVNSALTVTNSSISANVAITPTGGGFAIAGRAFISNSQFVSNTAQVGGGAIGVDAGAVVSFVNSRVEQNKAYHVNDVTEGAGIRSAGTLMISGTIIINNRASVGQHGSRGGGIYQAAGTLSLSNVTVQGNHAIHGAGVNLEAGSASIDGSTFTQNFAESGNGGGLRSGSASVTVNGSTFSSNYAVMSGGGIASGGTLVMTGTQIVANGAYNSGGGFINYNIATFNNSTVSGNNAQGGGEGYGGAIANGGTLTLKRTMVSNNYANIDGGGIFNNGTLYVYSSTVSNNVANAGDEVQSGKGGGGIMNSGLGATTSLQDSTLSANTTNKRDGGAVYNYYGLLYALNTTISGNHAPGWGGGIVSNFGYASLIHATFSGNSAAAGGGIYQLTTYPTRTVLMQNTIFANSPSGKNCAEFPGSLDIQSYGYNLSDDDSFSTAAFCPSFWAYDISNTSAKLGPLANNGGPTLTHLPLRGSAAIDRIPIGSNYCGAQYVYDQRGRPRPVNGDSDPAVKCDIGAVEYTPGDVTPLLYLPLIRR